MVFNPVIILFIVENSKFLSKRMFGLLKTELHLILAYFHVSDKLYPFIYYHCSDYSVFHAQVDRIID